MGWGGVIDQLMSEMCQICNHFDIYYRLVDSFPLSEFDLMVS